MNIALWSIQVILALMFLFAGFTKAFTYEKAKATMPWVKDYPKGFVIFIGIAELFGAIGLILPYALDIVPILTSIAAYALAAVMIFATILHIKRKEYQAIITNIVILACALFIAIGRM